MGRSAWSLLRLARDKAAHYRMRHLHQRTGVSPRGLEPSPGEPTPFESGLLRLGEETGSLDDCLRLLADYFEAEDRMMRRLLRQAAYPMMTAAAAAFIAPLPLLMFVGAGSYLAAVAGTLTLLVLASGALLKAVTRWYLNQPRYVRGRLLRALTIAVESGAGLERATTLAAEASGSAAVIEHVRRQHARQRAAQSPAETFRGCPHVHAAALAAMEVAAASGDYRGSIWRMAVLEEG